MDICQNCTTVSLDSGLVRRDQQQQSELPERSAGYWTPSYAVGAQQTQTTPVGDAFSQSFSTRETVFHKQITQPANPSKPPNSSDPDLSQFYADLREDLYLNTFGEPLPSLDPGFLQNTGLGAPFPTAIRSSTNDELIFDWPFESSCTSQATANTASSVSDADAQKERAHLPPPAAARDGPINSDRSLICIPSKRTCLPALINILKSLHVAQTTITNCLHVPSINSTSVPLQPRKCDTVLALNASIFQFLSQIFECACSLQPRLQLLLVVVYGKVLAWCRAILRSSSTDSRTQQAERDNDEPPERVDDVPINLGTHVLDTSLNHRIKAQVVHSELRSLETLFVKLEERTKEGSTCVNQQPRSNSGDGRGRNNSRVSSISAYGSSNRMRGGDGGFTDEIRCGLMAHLSRQLRGVRAELGTLG